MRNADEIEYRLIRDDLQAVIVTLNTGVAVTAGAIAMMYKANSQTKCTAVPARHGDLFGNDYAEVCSAR